MKKRNCRMSLEERDQHERATKIRKMTDQQLCEYMDAGCQYRPEDRFPIVRQQAVNDFLIRLSSMAGTGNGIGSGTVGKLKEFAQKEGYIK